VARVPWCEPTEGFCSPGFDAEPSDRNEGSMMFGTSLGPSGQETVPTKMCSWPRLMIGLVRRRADARVGRQVSCMDSSQT
jgi:hypothetical protein